MFTIYSIGDSAFLQQILNSVAMICGTGDFVQLVSIGLILGIIAVCIQSIISASKDFNLHHILLGWVMYACFFGPGVTVTIEDAYTGQVRVVDNVPIGVGFSGGLISNVGYGLTRLFQQGYQGADATNNQIFTESLRQLQAVRRNAGDAQVIEAINRAIDPTGSKGVDFEKSVANYMKECTFVKIALGDMTKEQLYRGNYQQTLPFQSKVYGTRLYLGNGAQDESPNCSVAWGLIQEALKKTEEANVIRVVNRVVGIKGIDPGVFPADTGAIDNSLRLMNLTGTTAQDFIRTSIIEPIYNRAAHGYYTDMGDIAAATMVSQAVAQRNTQWAAEQTMFMTTVRPLLTFFEGFILAITPVVGFLFVIGLFGIRLGVRYFQTLLWIQLWMPVISICNLYITMAARGDMASYSETMDSFYLLSRLDTTMQTWIATGGMLCAMTPIISLFLVTGSTYAFTTLASRLGGADHLNEKVAAPDALKVDPVHAQQAFAQGDSRGMMKTGWESQFQTLQFSKSADANVSSARMQVQGAQDTLANQLVNSDSQTRSLADSAGLTSSIGDNMRTSKSEAVATAYDKLYNMAMKFTDNTQKAHQFATQTLTQLGMSLGSQGAGAISGSKPSVAMTGANIVGKLMSVLGADIKSNGQFSTSDTDTVMAGIQKEAGEVAGIKFNDSDRAEITRAWSSALETKQGQEFTNNLAKSSNESISQSAQSYLSAQDNYQEAVSIREGMGSSLSDKSNEFLETAYNGPNRDKVRNYLGSVFTNMDAEDRQRVMDRANALMSSGFSTGGFDVATSVKDAATLEIMQNTPEKYADELSDTWKLATGLNTRTNYDVQKPEDMPTPKGATGSVDGNFDRLDPNEFDAKKASLVSAVEQGNQMAKRGDVVPEKLESKYESNSGAIKEQYDTKEAQGKANSFNKGIQDMEDAKVAFMNKDIEWTSEKAFADSVQKLNLPQEAKDYILAKQGIDPSFYQGNRDVLTNDDPRARMKVSNPRPAYGGAKMKEWQDGYKQSFENAIKEKWAPMVDRGLITEEQVNRALSSMDNFIGEASKADEDVLGAHFKPMESLVNGTVTPGGRPSEVMESKNSNKAEPPEDALPQKATLREKVQERAGFKSKP